MEPDMNQQDPLTMAHTRHYFSSEIQTLFAADRLPLSVIVADIDALGSINELHGTDVGDQLLIATARIMRSSCGEYALVARLGSDMFAAVMPNTHYNTAVSVCYQIEGTISNWPLGTSRVSITTGVATISSEDASVEDAIAQASNRMSRTKLIRGKGIQNEMFRSMLHILARHSEATRSHSQRMHRLALEVGEAMNLTLHDADDLAILCELHDIGKTAIPDRILDKPGPLTDDEWAVMRTHAEIGHDIVSGISCLSDIAKAILWHHERWDGSGYPMGLSGSDIPMISRILSIMDAYDAMTHDRPYRRALGHEYAISELNNCCGTQFDPDIVPVFVNIVHAHYSR